MEIKRIFDLVDNYEEKFNKDDVFAAKITGSWKKYSVKDYRDYSDNISYSLIAMGIKKGDKIITVTNNRPEWNFCDIGIMQVGAIHVPIYPTISDEEYTHILNNAEAKIVFVSSKLLYNRIKPIADTITSITDVFAFDEFEESRNWKEFLDLAKNNKDKYKEELLKIKDSIDQDDVCTLIYTSGTTGLSKGVMLSHKNFLSNVDGVLPRIPINETDRALSFLPLCHVYERMVGYTYQTKGLSIYYAENMGTIANDLKTVKASLFTTVPRLLETVYDKIITKGKDLEGFKKAIFNWSLKLASNYDIENQNFISKIKMSIADKLVFSKWREALGGNIKLIVSGGASLQPKLATSFYAAKIMVAEGYGLTETSPVIAFNDIMTKDGFMIGSVGPIIHNTEVKIADDGEILVKGPGIMKGYYNNEKETKAVIKDDWFHTGDVGEIVNGKFLKITDRKKEIFKNSAGKYIAPQVIENKFKESFLVQQIMVVGDGEKFASALISPNFNYLHYWATKHKIHFRDNKELIQNEDILKKVQDEITRQNKELAAHEQLKRFRLVCDEWTTQSGELSPTLKKKRRILYKKYDHILRDIYQYAEGEEDRAIKK